MNWFEILKLTDNERREDARRRDGWLAGSDWDLDEQMPKPVDLQTTLPESPKRKKCPKDQRWCPKCGKCDSLEEWRKHNQGE